MHLGAVQRQQSARERSNMQVPERSSPRLPTRTLHQILKDNISHLNYTLNSREQAAIPCDSV